MIHSSGKQQKNAADVQLLYKYPYLQQMHFYASVCPFACTFAIINTFSNEQCNTGSHPYKKCR
jgi:hypothetical protein